MNCDERDRRVLRTLDGFAHGPGAPIQATARALLRAKKSRAVILVEGISDQIAIETLALRRGRDLAAERVVVLPIGGAQAITRFARKFGPGGEGLILAGFCDVDAVETIRRGLIRAGVGNPQTEEDLAEFGFHICVKDLEDELIRAVGPENVEAVIESQGELGSFRTLQKQPEWLGRPTHEQLHRFLRSKARRNMRYARLLIEAVATNRIPRPLDAVLAHV